MKAIWKDTVLAESDDVVVVENNHYFPLSSINKVYFLPSITKTYCPWKGDASYFTIEVDGKINADAAWYYPKPTETVNIIRDRIAFWKGVKIVD